MTAGSLERHDNSRRQLTGCVVSGGHRTFVFLKKADCVVSTSQEANLVLLVVRKMIWMFLYEMNSYPLRAGPPGTTEGTLALPMMFVSGMPCQFLRSLIRFSAIGTVMQPSKGLATSLRVSCASQILILSIFLTSLSCRIMLWYMGKLILNTFPLLLWYLTGVHSAGKCVCVAGAA